jgi:hypothetical protein
MLQNMKCPAACHKLHSVNDTYLDQLWSYHLWSNLLA